MTTRLIVVLALFTGCVEALFTPQSPARAGVKPEQVLDDGAAVAAISSGPEIRFADLDYTPIETARPLQLPVALVARVMLAKTVEGVRPDTFRFVLFRDGHEIGPLPLEHPSAGGLPNGPRPTTEDVAASQRLIQGLITITEPGVYRVKFYAGNRSLGEEAFTVGHVPCIGGVEIAILGGGDVFFRGGELVVDRWELADVNHPYVVEWMQGDNVIATSRGNSSEFEEMVAEFQGGFAVDLALQHAYCLVSRRESYRLPEAVAKLSGPMRVRVLRGGHPPITAEFSIADHGLVGAGPPIPHRNYPNDWRTIRLNATQLADQPNFAAKLAAVPSTRKDWDNPLPITSAELRGYTRSRELLEARSELSKGIQRGAGTIVVESNDDTKSPDQRWREAQEARAAADAYWVAENAARRRKAIQTYVPKIKTLSRQFGQPFGPGERPDGNAP